MYAMFVPLITVLTIQASADPEKGDRGSGPPWKITSYMGFYRE